MSGQPAYRFKITRNGKQPTEVTVTEDGQQSILMFGCYVSDKRIGEMLPRMISDRKSTKRRKAGRRG